MSETEPNSPHLRLDSVKIRLGTKTLIEVTADIAPGEVLTVMGASGSGKSTLLAYIAGFMEPVFAATGRVFLNGNEITALPAQERRTGLLFQDALLFPHMSVGENLLFAMPRSVAAAGERRETAEAALADAGLEGFFERDPATLSGGQKARAALTRILLARPRALLLDEPFSKLDANRRGQIREFVFSTARRNDLPVLLVTHDGEDARAAGGRIFDLDRQVPGP